MKVLRQALAVGIAIVMGLLITAGARAAAIDDADALRGVAIGKGVFLLDFSSPKKLDLYLKVINGTYDGLVRQDVEPDFILVFIGPTVRFLTTEPDDELAMEYGDVLKDIAASIRELKRRDVKLEICAVATNVFNVDNDKVLPELQVVGDGFISLIGYQSQGYHLVPIF
jgi:intracellular sulfur oxidation DsrE/DsrF family protein